MGKQLGINLFFIPAQHLKIERLILISAIGIQFFTTFLPG